MVARLNRLATQRTSPPLPWAQSRLLSTIEDQGAARISELAALDHCSQPTMTMQVRRLEDAGLVARTADPDDRRAVQIRITPEGSRTLARVRADRAAVIDPHLSRLEPSDRETLAAAVEVLRRLLKDAATPLRPKEAPPLGPREAPPGPKEAAPGPKGHSPQGTVVTRK